MSEDSPLYGGRAISVTTDDGTLFDCEPYEMGGFMTPRAFRWRLIDTAGQIHTGPLYDAADSPNDVQRLVDSWWRQRKDQDAGSREIGEFGWPLS